MNTYEITNPAEAEIARLTTVIAMLEKANRDLSAMLQAADPQERVRKWMQTAGQQCNDKPTEPDNATCLLRARLTIEEAIEKAVEGYGVLPCLKCKCGRTTEISHVKLLEFLKWSPVNMTAIADAIADIQVVNLGDAVAIGIDASEAFEIVMDSNDSKFVWGLEDLRDAERKGFKTDVKQMLPNGFARAVVKDGGGKVIKPRGYKKADLAEVVS